MGFRHKQIKVNNADFKHPEPIIELSKTELKKIFFLEEFNRTVMHTKQEKEAFSKNQKVDYTNT